MHTLLGVTVVATHCSSVATARTHAHSTRLPPPPPHILLRLRGGRTHAAAVSPPMRSARQCVYLHRWDTCVRAPAASVLAVASVTFQLFRMCLHVQRCVCTNSV